MKRRLVIAICDWRGIARAGAILFLLAGLTPTPSQAQHQCLTIMPGECQCLEYSLEQPLGTRSAHEVAVIKMKDFELKLGSGSTHLPLMVVRDKGQFTTLAARAADLVERLGMAFDMMQQHHAQLQIGKMGGQPVVVVNDHLPHEYRLCTLDAGHNMPHERHGTYQGDRAAEYLLSVVAAFRTLFVDQDNPKDFEIVESTVNGKVLYTVYLKAREIAEDDGRPDEMTKEDIQWAIEMLPESERQRLYNLAHVIPSNWRS